MQRDVERVVGRGAVALDANVGGDRLRRSEQYQCLVEQVSAEVEPDAGAGQRLFTPCARPELGTETIKMGFERRDAAEDTFRQECLQRDEVTHVPAVLVGRQGERKRVGGGKRGDIGGGRIIKKKKKKRKWTQPSG